MSRAIWTGNIAFGLVSIPIEMYSAVQDRDIHFHIVTPDGRCRLRQKLYCPETGKEYDFSQTAKGYEIAPGEMVVVDPDELKALKPEAGHVIQVEQFVELNEVDPLLFDRAYILAPGKRADKAYALLRDSIADSGKVGIGNMVMRDHEYTGVLRTYDRALVFNTIHYSEEMRSLEDFEIPSKTVKVDKQELTLAKQLISSMAAAFKHEKFVNEYKEEVEELLDKKSKGKKVVKLRSSEGAKEKSGKVIDLMSRLKQSINQTKGAKKNERKKTVPKRKRA